MRKRRGQDGLRRANSFCSLARLPALSTLQLCNHYKTHYATSPVQQHCAINASCVLSSFLSQSDLFSLLTAGVYGYYCTWSHSHTPHSEQDSSGRVISPIHGPVPNNTQHSQQTDISMPPAGFELAIAATERPQTDALDRAATGIASNASS